MKFVACYIRISALEESYGMQKMQRQEINQWLKSKRINPKSVRWYIDKVSEQEQTSSLVKLQKDILANKVRAAVVWHLDRLSLSTRDRLSMLSDWCKASLRVISVSQQIEIKPGDCKMIGSVLEGATDIHAQTIRARTKAGLAKARARGRMGGRPPVTADEPKVQKAKELYKAGKLRMSEICKQLEISKATLWRYIRL